MYFQYQLKKMLIALKWANRGAKWPFQSRKDGPHGPVYGKVGVQAADGAIPNKGTAVFVAVGSSEVADSVYLGPIQKYYYIYLV